MQKNTFKYCPKCERDVPISDFHKSKATLDGLTSMCKGCATLKSRQWRIDNPERYKDQNYKYKYGITRAEVERLKVEQDYKCAICGEGEEDVPRGTLFVDHCHSSAEVRGMLCHNCNTALGYFKDEPGNLIQGVGYLIQYKENPVKDLRKARDYLNVLIDVSEGKSPKFGEWK